MLGYKIQDAAREVGIERANIQQHPLRTAERVNDFDTVGFGI